MIRTLSRAAVMLLLCLCASLAWLQPAYADDEEDSGPPVDEVSMGSLVIDGLHEGVGKIRESKLEVFLVTGTAPAYKVHFRLQFHAPFDWGDPNKVLEANVTLDREQFLTLVTNWNKALESWLVPPKEMASQGDHGKVTDESRPKERYILLASIGGEAAKILTLAFVDPRPLFTKKHEYVKRIDGLLTERDVNTVSRILCRVKERARWQ